MKTQTDSSDRGTRPLEVRDVPIDSLSLDPANARLHDERNLEAIKGSLARFGQQKPIVVDSAGVIRAGNGTYEAARVLGWETIQVVVTDLLGTEATAYAIADNRSSDLSEFDQPSLGKLLEELRAEDALDGVGFDDAEISAWCLAAGLEDLRVEHLTVTGAGDAENLTVSLWVGRQRADAPAHYQLDVA